MRDGGRMNVSGRVVGFIVLLTVVTVGAECALALGPRYTSPGRAQVVEIVAPNLVKIKMMEQGRILTVRLLGVGSPRNRDRIKALEPAVLSYIQRNDLWEESRRYVESLLEGKVVEVWTRKWDRFDDKNRLLAYLMIPNGSAEPLDVNAHIIKNGFGLVTRDYVHVTFTEYRHLEKDAMRNRRGIWRGLTMDRYSLLDK
jgi:endonuclease YncB( thermonuclease family)